MVNGRDYPSIVVEAGWSESGRDLIEDAHLWLWGTEPPVEFVILVAHVESKKEKGNLTEPEMEESLSNGKCIEVMGPPTDDEAIQLAWRGQLLQLHHEEKLMKPLLGSVKSILYIYRRTRDGDDETKTASKTISTDQGTIHQGIYREFEAEIYPDVPTKEIKLRWRDILGSSPPEAFRARDLDKHFCIDLQRFHDSIKRSIQMQIKSNANSRAVDILERRGVISSQPSHSELKKGSGPNMLDGQQRWR